LPPSSLLSWWLLALLRSRKVGSDKLTETREITPYFGCIPTTMIGDRTEAAQASPMA
jgi:hypothetical protein